MFIMRGPLNRGPLKIPMNCEGAPLLRSEAAAQIASRATRAAEAKRSRRPRLSQTRRWMESGLELSYNQIYHEHDISMFV